MRDVALTRVPADWPYRAFSRSISSGSLEWHVQVLGSGPVVVLLHGTGSSAHSWADVTPSVAAVATVVAPDLPGHGFTTGASIASLSLPRIAVELEKLLALLNVGAPALIAGHSAGAALAIRWALQGATPPRAIVGFNPSLVAPPASYTKVLGALITPIATSVPVTSVIAAAAARTSLVDRLLASTGSVVPEAQRRRYAELLKRAANVRGAMGLMAAADLPALVRDAGDIDRSMTFAVGSNDRWVPERSLLAVINRAFPRAAVQRWDGGHVMHEVDPARAAALICAALRGTWASEPAAESARKGNTLGAP
jgi:magnesium chelatase accessory protein